MKRLFSFMMALVLVLSLSVTVFAAEDTGSITVTNAKVGETYTVYKIFDAALTEDKSGISYSVVPGSALATEMFGATGTGRDYFTYDATSGAVALKSGVSESNLFTYLKTLENMEKIGESIPATSATVDFKNLPYGYYLISSTLGATVTIDSTKPHADVIDKNQTTIALDKQVKLHSDTDYDADDSISANVGDTVDFKVGFTALNYKGDKKIDKYTIEDTLTPTDWAAIDPTSIVVTVGTKTLTARNDYTINADANGFKIEIPWMDASGGFLYDSSVPVEVTYSATVLDAAAKETPTDNENTAKLTWDNTTAEDKTTTKVYNMGVTKVDGANSAPLAGAKFGLYSDSACETPVNVKATGTNGVYMVNQTSGSNVFETLADGEIVIMGLKEGTYYLKELEAPAGYNLLDSAQAVIVGGADTDTVKTSYTVNNADLDIENNKGMELPSTGGKGTMMLITIGSMVAMAFAVLLITHKKMSVYHD